MAPLFKEINKQNYDKVEEILKQNDPNLIDQRTKQTPLLISIRN